ncbi:TetR/AcrR family transcriptional regulator [Micromonospora sp. D93]|uniref:TetR/AcrR family transcriptional regulator n=1 Tax=Micromonospora sp. D93 TaxID=2824886 RepID=UPI001B37692F|nr:TetR/AcrR family transcriptional regulator [Micromonospora sp. D93]MBQ1021946.1 TetR/AcrR family transcriptional regulator [Micromonospora sp. D93]
MSVSRATEVAGGQGEGGRRKHVLKAALHTFARYGYRKTSMDDVARAADISRPGLYFLFSSKENLFRDAVIDALDRDLAAAARVLEDTERPLRDRLVEAFDLWTGRYIGAMATEFAVLIDSNPDLLGPIVRAYPQRFVAMITNALADALPAPRTGMAEDMARTLHSTAAGIKHEVATRAEFGQRMTIAIDLFVPVLVDGSASRYGHTP